MGYWDKKEEVYKVNKPKEHEEGKKFESYNPEDINHDALKELEETSNEGARELLDNIENLADDIARQKRQFGDLLSTSYWCAIVFNNTTQKQEFLSHMGYDPSWTFIDGKNFARRCGAPVSEPDRDYKERGVQKAFKERARELPKNE